MNFSFNNKCVLTNNLKTLNLNTTNGQYYLFQYLLFQYIILIILITLVFLLYIQFSPGMGQIWIRNGSFMPRGAFNLIIYPFKNIRMWKPNVWDINYPMWIFVSVCIFKYYKYYLVTI